MNQRPLSDEMLDTLQRETFQYFQYENNPANGLVTDKTKKGAPAGIAGIGLALVSLYYERQS